MAEYELYCFAESGNSYKAALMLALVGADWAPRRVDYFNGETRTDAYRADVNEMGEVPVMVHQGRKLSQSGVILDYLAERSGKFGWANDDERRRILRWLLFDNHKFTSYMGMVRFLTTFMNQDDQVTAFVRGRRDAALAIAEKHLDGRHWMTLDRPTIADLSMAGYIYYDGELGIDFAGYPAIDTWRERLRELPGWRPPYDLMPRAGK
jgi:glutathione S-transferase